MTPLELLTPTLAESTVAAKLADLRSHLTQHQLDAYLIPSADEHLNEYLPQAKQRRDWVSGFTGSAGDLLVGQQQSWLFVDSRYYEQADLQVDSALIQVSKLGLEGHKTLVEILSELGEAATLAQTPFRLGFDPATLAIEQFRTFQKQVQPLGVTLVPIAGNLVDAVRSQTPWSTTDPVSPCGHSTVFRVPETTTGESPIQKLARVREEMKKARVDGLPLTKLDQIAWLLNLRGWDIPYNPVFMAYAVITAEQAFLFTNLDRLSPEIQTGLAGWTLHPYEDYNQTVTAIAHESTTQRIWLDPKHTTLQTQQLFSDPSLGKGLEFVEMPNPLEGMKARKNHTELAGMRRANLQASRAKIRTFKWMSDRLAAGERVSEWDVAQIVERFYQAEPDFQGLSFNAIAGTGSNSSIVHYGTPNPAASLEPGQLFLLDSGAQYLSGTTDDTRTISTGHPTPDQIARYTEVLKAHINCAMQRFPKGTTGAQLDGITRSNLWFAGLDFGHGTGHGVGAFLNVHEGPNGISKRAHEPLEPGMINSIEPGFYEPGWGGIRIENLYVVVELPTSATTGSSATWYGFESLTYIPFDKKLIDLDALDARQRQWLEDYHQAILDKLLPTLDAEEAAWLQQACQLPGDRA